MLPSGSYITVSTLTLQCRSGSCFVPLSACVRSILLWWRDCQYPYRNCSGDHADPGLEWHSNFVIIPLRKNKGTRLSLVPLFLFRLLFLKTCQPSGSQNSIDVPCKTFIMSLMTSVSLILPRHWSHPHRCQDHRCTPSIWYPRP